MGSRVWRRREGTEPGAHRASVPPVTDAPSPGGCGNSREGEWKRIEPGTWLEGAWDVA